MSRQYPPPPPGFTEVPPPPPGFTLVGDEAQPEAAPAPKSLYDTVKQHIMGEAQPVLDMGVGALKAGGGALKAGLDWQADIPRQVMDMVRGRQNPFSRTNDPGSTPGAISPLPARVQTGEVFEPTNTSQRVGKMLGNAGMGTAAAMATGGASLPVQVGAGGLAGMLMEPDNPDVSAGLGMGAPLLGSALGGLGRSAKTKSEELVTSAIDPRGMVDKAALKKVIEKVAAEKPFAWSSEGLMQQFVNKADDANTVIDDIIQSTGQGQRIINPNIVANKIDAVIDTLKDPNTGKIITQENRQMAAELGRIKGEIRSLGKGGGTTLESLRKLKQDFGQVVKAGQAQNFARILPVGSRAAAAREGYAAAQQGMIDAAPGLREAGQAYHQAATVRDLLRKTDVRGSGGSTSPMGRYAKIGLTVTGHPGSAAALHGAEKVVSSTPAKLGGAALLQTAAQALKAGNLSAAAAAIGQLIRQVPVD